MIKQTIFGFILSLGIIGCSTPEVKKGNLSNKKIKNFLGQNIAYIDEGVGRPVVFLHGNPLAQAGSDSRLEPTLVLFCILILMITLNNDLFRSCY